MTATHIVTLLLLIGIDFQFQLRPKKNYRAEENSLKFLRGSLKTGTGRPGQVDKFS
jgi:hypothetical protein